MTPDILDRQLEGAQQRLQELMQHVGTPPEQQAVVAEALEQLSIALHELQVASEELREQNTELAAAHVAVENERQRYQELFEFAPDGYVVTDADAVIQEANRAAATILRVRQDFLIGKPLAVFVPAADTWAFNTLLNRLRQGQDMDLVETRLVPRDGAPFPARLRIALITDRNGRLIGLRWSIRDITKLKEAQERALQAERLAAIGQMVAGLTHEGRNAVQRSKACLDMLALQLRDEPQSLDLVVRAQRAQDDLHQVYEQVREYAVPLILERKICSLDEVMYEVWERLDFLREGRQATLRTDESDVDSRCEADRFLIGQVFRNILENSLAACSDPIEITVQSSAVELDGRPALQIAVRDNGPGLAPEQREKIFEPFYTTKTRGTGLGMALAKRIIETHGGRIAVGKSGQGTEIIVTLPRSTSLQDDQLSIESTTPARQYGDAS